MSPPNPRQVGEQALLSALHRRLPELKAQLEGNDLKDAQDECLYRFYHQSFKVYRYQETTLQLVETLKSLAPEAALHPWFLRLIQDGTGKTWEQAHNRRWLEETRPIVEAFHHAYRFLELAVECGETLQSPPEVLPTGWAAFLYLYQLR